MLMCADDMVLIAASEQGLHTALLQLEATTAQWGMQLNYGKTVIVSFGTQQQQQQPI